MAKSKAGTPKGAGSSEYTPQERAEWSAMLARHKRLLAPFERVMKIGTPEYEEFCAILDKTEREKAAWAAAHPFRPNPIDTPERLGRWIDARYVWLCARVRAKPESLEREEKGLYREAVDLAIGNGVILPPVAEIPDLQALRAWCQREAAKGEPGAGGKSKTIRGFRTRRSPVR